MHELEITQCFLYSIYFPLGLRLFPPSSPLLRSQAFYFHECDSGICWPFVGARLNSALIESYASVKGASGERNATKNRTHNTVKLPQPNRFCNDTTATAKLSQPPRFCNDAPATVKLPQYVKYVTQKKGNMHGKVVKNVTSYEKTYHLKA